MVSELVTAEQGMMLQNLGLICQAMGLGGFPNFAEHEFSWFEALGFRMGAMPASKYLGANIFTREVMRLLGRNQAIRMLWAWSGMATFCSSPTVRRTTRA
jgi:hypothetical protein